MARLSWLTLVWAPDKRNAEELEEGRKSIAWHKAWLDEELQEHDFFVNNQMTVADIAAFCDLGFQKLLGVEIDPKLKSLLVWCQRMESRPSATARESVPGAARVTGGRNAPPAALSDDRGRQVGHDQQHAELEMELSGALEREIEPVPVPLAV